MAITEERAGLLIQNEENKSIEYDTGQVPFEILCPDNSRPLTLG